MNGWPYEYIDQLPADVYDILVDEMNMAFTPPTPSGESD